MIAADHQTSRKICPIGSIILFEFFRMEFSRIYRIYRICKKKKLFSAILKMKIIKNSLLQIP